MTEAVLADAQFGIERILRPFPGFEAVYDGQLVQTPIMFSEQGKPLDPMAGNPGYSPQLLNGLSIPFGARIVIWLPSVIAVNPDLSTIPYCWLISFRLRNTFDFRQSRIPFHLAKQGAGVPDTTAPVGQQARVVLPAAHQTVVYNQSEPTGNTTRVCQHLRVEDISPRLDGTIQLPFLSDGSRGVYQQGLLDPAVAPALASQPFYEIYEIQAAGDEMFIGIYREGAGHPTWELTTPPRVDAQISNLFGTGQGKEFPDIGVYVNTGSAP